MGDIEYLLKMWVIKYMSINIAFHYYALVCLILYIGGLIKLCVLFFIYLFFTVVILASRFPL